MNERDSNIHKFLISAPCYFVGEYKSSFIDIESVLPSKESSFRIWDNIHPSPYSRNFLMLKFNADEPDDNEIKNFFSYILPKRLCILLAVFYGKCITEYGFIESGGKYWMPEIANIGPNRYYYIPPFNQLARKDLGDLTISPSGWHLLDKISLLQTLLGILQDNCEFNDIFFTAGSFYLHSLQTVNVEPEIAYIDLISCGEVLSNYDGFNFNENELLPEELLEQFGKLESKCGDILNVQSFKNYFRSIKRRFVMTLTGLLNNYYFENENNDLPADKYIKREYLNRISKERAQQHIKYSYDLRSLYIHAGKAFAQYIIPFQNMISETRIGEVTNDVGDSEYRKIVNNSLTYVGLERLTRFCLLRFIHKFGNVHIDDRLNDDQK